MRKEYLETLESMKNRLIDAKFTIEGTTLYSKNRDLDDDYKLLKEALQRLEVIDNANPSKALNSLSCISNFIDGHCRKTTAEDDVHLVECFDIIEQTLIKLQEREKVLEIIWEKNVLIYNLKIADNLIEYNRWVSDENKLTQEKFDLVKRYSNEQLFI